MQKPLLPFVEKKHDNQLQKRNWRNIELWEDEFSFGYQKNFGLTFYYSQFCNSLSNCTEAQTELILVYTYYQLTLWK